MKWAPLSKQSSYTRVYSETGNPNELRSQLRPVTSAGNETDTDLALFLQGYVTLTLLDGDLGVRDGAAADSRHLTPLEPRAAAAGVASVDRRHQLATLPPRFYPLLLATCSTPEFLAVVCTARPIMESVSSRKAHSGSSA